MGSAVAQARVMLVLTMLFWGGNAVAGKFAVGEVSPFLLSWFRWTIAAVVLGAVALPRLRQDWPTIRTRLPYFVAMGALGFTVFNGMLYYALISTTAINATIIQAAMPMFIFALNFFIYRTTATPWQILGYTLTLAGVTVAAGRGDLLGLAGLDFNRGDILMIAATVIYAAYSVALRQKPQVHWLSFVAMLVGIGSLASVPFVGLEALTGTSIWPRTSLAWTVIVYAAVFPSIIAQAFFIRGIEVLGSNAGGLYLNLMPIMGALLSIALLGERFHLFHAAALVLVLGGIAVAQRRRVGA